METTISKIFGNSVEVFANCALTSGKSTLEYLNAKINYYNSSCGRNEMPISREENIAMREELNDYLLSIGKSIFD